MAVTPKEALGNKPEALRKQADALETKIDEALRRSFDNRVSVSYELPVSLDTWVREEVKRRFERAGWTVKHNSWYDQRDGDGSQSLTFSAKVADPVHL